ncbi:hypothetical protein [Pseudomonas indica]|uniref:hypothetical protein n=1 Tax=Pseudomonas indica TaxID=137658 RepID=UPI0023F9A84F|nr:hypothetical protein [Pseudomonas indica]
MGYIPTRSVGTIIPKNRELIQSNISHHTTISMRKTLKYSSITLLILAHLATTGCQTNHNKGIHSTQSSREEQLNEAIRFSQELRNSFIHRAFDANIEQLTGNIEISFSLDKNNNLLNCETRPGKNDTSNLEDSSKELSIKMAHLCWSLVPPEAPKRKPENEISKFKINLTFTPDNDNGEKILIAQNIRQRQKYAQSQFAWNNIFADQKIDSIGSAIFKIETNTFGNLLDCNVRLDAHPLRENGFKQDKALRKTLKERCMQLDTTKFPFLAKDRGNITTFVRVEYTPWRNYLSSKAAIQMDHRGS